MSLLPDGTLAFSLVKHSVSSSCSDLNLLVLLLHSPISTKLDCSPGLFPFRLWEKQTCDGPISLLLLKIGFIYNAVMLIICIDIFSNTCTSDLEYKWYCES